MSCVASVFTSVGAASQATTQHPRFPSRRNFPRTRQERMRRMSTLFNTGSSFETQQAFIRNRSARRLWCEPDPLQWVALWCGLCADWTVIYGADHSDRLGGPAAQARAHTKQGRSKVSPNVEESCVPIWGIQTSARAFDLRDPPCRRCPREVRSNSLQIERAGAIISHPALKWVCEAHFEVNKI